MAGVDKEFLGEAEPAPGIKIGYLPQEPQLDATKDVRGNVEEAVEGTRALLARFEDVSAKFAEPERRRMDKLIDEQAQAAGRDRGGERRELDRTVEIAMDALRCPPGDAEVSKLSGGEKRRVALCRLLLSKPDMLLLDEPTNHLDAESVAWLEQSQGVPGTVVAITHDRYFLDNVAELDPRARSRRGHPVEGELLVVARAEAEAARRRGEAGVGAADARSPASSNGCASHPRRGRRRARRAWRRTKSSLSRKTERLKNGRDRDPPGAASRRQRGDRREAQEGVR